MLKVVFLLLALSSAVGKWVPMDDENMPYKLKDWISFGVNNFMGKCPRAEDTIGLKLCPIEFNAMPEMDEAFKFVFHEGCEGGPIKFSFDKLPFNVSIHPEHRAHVVIKPSWRITLRGDPEVKIVGNPLSGLSGPVVWITVDLLPGCKVTMLHGTAVVEVPDTTTTILTTTLAPTTKSVPVFTTTVNPRNESVLCVNQREGKTMSAHIIWAVCVGIVVIIGTIGAVIYCCYQKKIRERSVPVNFSKQARKNKSVMNGPTTLRSRRPAKSTIVPVAVDVPATEEVVEGGETGVARRLVKNNRLRYLLKSGPDAVSQEVEKTTFYYLKSADDSRNGPNDVYSVILATEAYYLSTSVFSFYFKSSGSSPELSPEQESKKISENRKKYFSLGPPKVESDAVNDKIATDTMPNYLHDIYVISYEKRTEMENVLPHYFQNCLWPAEIDFALTADHASAITAWKALIDAGRDVMASVIKLKKDLPELYRFNQKKTSAFVNLCWFYELYGEYINKFPLKEHHLSRLPLQGLMLLMFRPDLSPDMQKKVLAWIKVTSFGLLRRNDYGANGVVIAYPLVMMVKLWYPHDFTKLAASDINEMREMLDCEEPVAAYDWECI